MSTTAVVILNWNGRAFLEQFLPHVLQHNSAGAEIIVADNASTDDSVSWLQQHYPQVRIIRNAVNGGYAKGYNDALKEVSADYFVLLNSDVEVSAGWLEPVIQMLDSDPAIAACQPKLRAFHQRDQFEYAGAAGGFIDKWGYPFCRGRIFDSYEKDEGQYDDACEIFWATGACLFVRSKAFNEVGGLDEDFFAHMEEIDLCWRLKNTGYRVMYCPSSVVYHVGGGTLSKQSAQKTFLNFRNNLVLMAKNHAPGFFWLKLFLRMCMDFIAGAKFLFSNGVAHFWAVQRAHFSFYGMMGSTLRKRKEMKKRIKHFTTSAVYKGNIVADYFLRKKKKFTDLDPEKFG
ncbi:MAG: family 2 glycosyl transferase [Bacteroidetes bacterium]|nr:MAG: family 2 glycosyl transferase [Bacteroidota bacterium]